MNPLEPNPTPAEVVALLSIHAEQLAMLVSLVDQLTREVQQQGHLLATLQAEVETLRASSTRH